MKKILSFVFLLAILQAGYSQSASKNEEHCRSLESTKSVQRINATFEISTLNLAEQNSLASYIYQINHNIYKVNFTNDNTIQLFHIDVVTIEYLKELLIQQNCYINLISIVNLNINNQKIP